MIKTNVYVDGISASGTENRDKILKARYSDSIAVAYNDIKIYLLMILENMFSGKSYIYLPQFNRR
ncbi:hypothetical protein Q5M85_03540 [Paraclostridium bifermentans]|nr:hypothetical protein [Paraclostridium bifermentans]